MKFIHASDLHIDSPLCGLDSYSGAPAARLRGATRQALIALVDLAIEQSVDLVLLAGDIYDGNWSDFRTGLFFREQMVRLTGAGIRVFIVKGNHDAESLITKPLPPVQGVHIFNSRKSETVEIEHLSVAIHGRSFPKGAVSEDLVPEYPDPVAGKFNIGMLHTSLSGRVGHDTYAPTTVEILSDKGYDYFALGHVHAREIVREANPRIVYPGNLQGRYARETGPKGCELVVVSGGRVEFSEFQALDVVRWHQMTIDASQIDTIDDLSKAFSERASALVRDARDRLHAIRVILNGQSKLSHIEAEHPGAMTAAVQAATQGFDDADIWIEEVRLDLQSPVDRKAIVERQDAMGEVVRLVDGLTGDDQRLVDWIRQQLSELGKLPAALADVDPTALNASALRAALADAEATVLAQLSGAAQAGRAGK